MEDEGVLIHRLTREDLSGEVTLSSNTNDKILGLGKAFLTEHLGRGIALGEN